VVRYDYQSTMSMEGETIFEEQPRSVISDPFGDVPEGVYTEELNAALAANPELLSRIHAAQSGELE